MIFSFVIAILNRRELNTPVRLSEQIDSKLVRSLAGMWEVFDIIFGHFCLDTDDRDYNIKG